MGEIFMRSLTEADQLWICDYCEQQGVRANGKDIVHNGETIMWYCYNCVQKGKNEV